jgi:HAMP domain-containing protein
MLNRLRLLTKIVLVPLLCISIFLVLGAAIATLMNIQRTTVDEVTGVHLNRSKTAIEVYESLSKQHVAIFNVLALAGGENVDEEQVFEAGEESLASLADVESITAELAELFSRTDQEIALVQQIEQNLGDYRIAATSALEMATVDTALASEHILGANVSYQKLNDVLLQLVGLAKNDMASSLIGMSERTGHFQTQIILALLLGLIAIVAISVVVYKSIALSIRQLNETMLTLANGDMETLIPGGERKDEIGEMARSLEQIRTVGVKAAQAQSSLDDASSPMMIVDIRGMVIFPNKAMSMLFADLSEAMSGDLPGFGKPVIASVEFDTLHNIENMRHERLMSAAEAVSDDMTVGGRTVNLTASPVFNESGGRLGVVVEW